MSSNRSASIYILTGLLLIIGILIFAFKESMLSFLSVQIFGDTSNIQETVLAASPTAVINLQILERPTFKKLSPQVLYFDFNRVGKPVLNQTAHPNLQSPAWPAVYLGNSNPFPVKEKPASN